MLKKATTKLIICLLFTLNGIGAYASDWIKYVEKDGIIISYRYDDCHIPSQGLHQKFLYIQVKNTVSYKVNVTWDYLVQYTRKTVSNNRELSVSLVVNSGETVEGKCEIKGGDQLKLFVKFLDLPNNEELIDFKINNIVIKKI